MMKMSISKENIEKMIMNDELDKIVEIYNCPETDKDFILNVSYATSFNNNKDISGNPFNLNKTRLMKMVNLFPDIKTHMHLFDESVINNMVFLVENTKILFKTTVSKNKINEIRELNQKMWERGFDIKELVNDTKTFNKLAYLSNNFSIRYRSTSFENFSLYIINNTDDINLFDDKLELVSYLSKIPSMLQNAVDKGLVFDDEMPLYFAFHEANYTKLNALLKHYNVLNPDKLSRNFTDDIIKSVCERKNLSYIGLDIIELLSTLENFDDFVNNNYFFLMKVLSEDAINFIRRY